MKEPLVVFARITPKPHHLSEARRAILDIVARTRAETGCQAFTVYVSRAADEHIYLYEMWDDEAALEAHYAEPYTRAVFAQYENWLASPVEVTKLRGLE